MPLDYEKYLFSPQNLRFGRVNQTESDIPQINQPSRDRHAELLKEWGLLDARSQKITEKDVPAFTRKLWEAGIGAVRVFNR